MSTIRMRTWAYSHGENTWRNKVSQSKVQASTEPLDDHAFTPEFYRNMDGLIRSFNKKVTH